MLTVYMILQAPIETGATPENLAILNKLGLSVFLVGIGLLILLSAHYYRMRGTQQGKGRTGHKRTGGRHVVDGISQYEYMSREEMKAIALKEQAESEAAGKKNDEWVEYQTTQQQPELAAHEHKSATMQDQPMQSSRTLPETEILAKILLAPEEKDDVKAEETNEEQVKKKKEDTEKVAKHPYQDQIESSVWSNELPEEFRKKSREI